MVFYLKYRPKKIAELDSEALRERLETLLKGKLPDNIPHAFLFTGPKGLGKTSTARILAKSINCTNRKGSEIEPCNICASCKAINNGSSLDVIELDAASNRGIDELRDLREKIRLSPLSSHKKVYIIDEVHMLTTEAFNALLKTLEEPPSHAVFILCTTEPQKVPGTIASRCFRVLFQRATDEDLVHSFERIVKGEGIKADKDALAEIAKLSDGSFRDGAKILEDLSGTSHLTSSLVEKKYKTTTLGKGIDELINAFAKRDAKAGIDVISALANDGVDFKHFSETLINFLHAKLISQIGGEGFALSIGETKTLLGKLIAANGSIKYAVLPQLPLELLVVEWCSEEPVVASLEKEDTSEPAATPPKTVTRIGSKDDKILTELIEKIKPGNFSIAGLLRDSNIEKYDGKFLTLKSKYKFHKERLQEPKTVGLIEGTMKEITGKNIKVTIV